MVLATLPSKTLFSFQPENYIPHKLAPLYQYLQEQQQLRFLPKNSVVFLGDLNRLRIFWDEQLKKLMLTLQAEEMQLPVIVSETDLKAINFLDQQGQQLVLVGNKSSAEEHYCRSAVCQNCYPLWKNMTLPGPICWTVSGPVFRNETESVQAHFSEAQKLVAQLFRLKEFWVRDLVLIGPSEWVEAKLTICQKWWQDWFAQAQVKGRLQTATDHFHPQAPPELALFQLSQETKIEAQVWVPELESFVAVGSINRHHQHFTNAYQIKSPSTQPYVSACVGWGYERMVLACAGQSRCPPTP